MMKKIKFLPLIFLMIASLMGCSFGIKNNKKYVTLYVSVDDFENSKNGRAVIVPKTDDSDLYKFTLKAKKSGESSYLELTNFQNIKYNTLINTSLSLETGTWDFLLEAYVTFEGNSYLAATAEKTDEEITAERAAPISFTLNLSEAASDAKGGYKFDVSFQNTNVKLVKANCYKDANLTQQVGSTTEFKETDFSDGSFTLKNNALSAGYYYLQLLFYSDEAGTEKLAGRIISFKIVPYFVTSDTITYSDSFEKLQVYKIEYMDAGDSKFTGVTATDGKALDTIKFNASSSDITLPQSSEIKSTLNSDDNPIIFEGWYKNPGCTDPVSGFSQAELMNAVNNIPVYAKWSYKYVYLDPTAAKSNNGAAAGNPVKTVQEAKYRLGSNSEAVYVLSSISNADDIQNISGITTTSTNNAVLKRYSSFTDDPVIKVTTAIKETIKNVTIDGGAGWKKSSAIDSFQDFDTPNTGVIAEAPLVLVDGINASITFDENTTIQNNYNDSDTESGGGISIKNGKVITCSPSFTVKSNMSKTLGGGIYVTGSSAASFEMRYGQILDNYSTSGGAIAVDKYGSLSIGDDSILDENQYPKLELNRSLSTGGAIYTSGENSSSKINCIINNAVISNNQTINKLTSGQYGQQGSGGALYIKSNSSLQLTNVELNNNVAGSNGGAITISGSSNITLSSCKVENNKTYSGTSSKGPGAFVSQGKFILDGNTYFKDNVLSSKDVKWNDDIYSDIYITKDETSHLLIKSLTKLSEISKVAILTPAEYPTSETTFPAYSFVATPTDTAEKELIASYFEVSNNLAKPELKYKVDSNGYIIIANQSSGGGTITVPTNEDVSFALSSTSHVFGQSSVVTVSAQKEDTGDDITSVITDWDIHIYSGEVDITELGDVSIIDNQITFKSSLPPGNYKIVVTGKYNLLAYSQSFDFSVSFASAVEYEAGYSSENTFNIQDFKFGTGGDIKKAEIKLQLEEAVTKGYSYINLRLFSGDTCLKDNNAELSEILTLCNSAGITKVKISLDSDDSDEISRVVAITTQSKAVAYILDFTSCTVDQFNYSFTSSTTVEEIRLPSTIKSIGDGAFANCTNLKTVKIPENVESIGGRAFAQCSALTSIEFAGTPKLKSIGQQAFSDCTNLKKITIPASVTSIGVMTIMNSGVTDVEIEDITGWKKGYNDGDTSAGDAGFTSSSTDNAAIIKGNFTFTKL